MNKSRGLRIQSIDAILSLLPRQAQRFRLPQVYCKLSGKITEANPNSWMAEHLRPYVNHVMRVFGPDRLMFGSNWPVCMLAGTWKEALAAFTQSIGAQPMHGPGSCGNHKTDKLPVFLGSN